MKFSNKYKRAYNFGQKVVIIDTEQVGHITAIREAKVAEFKIEIAPGVGAWKSKLEIEGFEIWLETKR